MNDRSRNLFVSILLLTILSLACSSEISFSNPAVKPQVAGSYLPTPIPPTPLPEAMISFQVELPENTPPEQGIYLTILDEVTGLVLNPQRYLMQAQGPTKYTLSLPFPLGSVVKYRYARQSNPPAEEYLASGLPLRYRMLKVESPGLVTDRVARWNDTEFIGETGYLQGEVSDAESGEPVSGLLVNYAGVQTVTSLDGTFVIDEAPLGTQNLVIYARDGQYRTFQQGAKIVKSSVTMASIQVSRVPGVDVLFTVIVPSETPAEASVRLVGNLSQLGNTFSDLAAGANVLAERAPLLQKLPDGRYGIVLHLPVGTDIRYKYTLGDGFWNAEHTLDGVFVVRQLVVPETNKLVQDQVATWRDSQAKEIAIDFTAPADLPEGERVSVEFYVYGWTEPIPMWPLGGGRWHFTLYSPLGILGGSDIDYRFCYLGQCQ